MWTVNEAPPRQFRNQLIEAASEPAASTQEKFTYDYWRQQLALIRAALAPFPLALAAVVTALEAAAPQTPEPFPQTP
jgi:hypothetical protein